MRLDENHGERAFFEGLKSEGNLTTMLLGFLTILVMIAVTWAYLRLGLMTALTMCINVFVAGLLAFNFWEPIADTLDPMFTGTFLKGYEDALVLVLIFCAALALLRLCTNYLCSSLLVYPPALEYGGCILFSLATGYLTSGFLMAVLQTLPWHQNFMFFEYRHDPEQPAAVVRRVLPPDRVWLALMRRAGAYAFSNREDPGADRPADFFSERFTREHLTFDKYGTFELRYARYRRTDNAGRTLPYHGECDREVHKPP